MRVFFTAFAVPAASACIRRFLSSLRLAELSHTKPAASKFSISRVVASVDGVTRVVCRKSRAGDMSHLKNLHYYLDYATYFVGGHYDLAHRIGFNAGIPGWSCSGDDCEMKIRGCCSTRK